MSIEGQDHFFTVYFPGFVCFVLYKAKISGERLQGLWSCGLYFQGSRTEQEKLLLTSATLYIGNLSFYTTEEQIHELFSRCGDIKRIIMGLDKVKKTPCGFCFVEYP